MSFLPDELPIALDKLEDHLKAILKIKIREFVHLNPIFNVIPSIDLDIYSRVEMGTSEVTKPAVEVVAPVAPLIEVPVAEPITRTQFRQNILGAQSNQTGPLSERPHVDIVPVPVRNTGKYYFSGHDIECPNRGRQLPQRRRYTRVR